MPRITVDQANAWAEGTKLTFGSPFAGRDLAMLLQLESEVMARIANAYDITAWTDDSNTPLLVQTAIAKLFVAWAVRRMYSESIEENDAAYAQLLEGNAEMIITGIIDGTIDIPGVETPSTIGPGFYPTDASSALRPTREDPSLGPPKFSMGMVF